MSGGGHGLVDSLFDGIAEVGGGPVGGGGSDGGEAPIGKGVAVGTGEVLNEFADAAAAGEQLLDQRLHVGEIASVPLGRNLVGGSPYGVGGQGLKAREPRLEGLPSGH